MKKKSSIHAKRTSAAPGDAKAEANGPSTRNAKVTPSLAEKAQAPGKSSDTVAANRRPQAGSVEAKEDVVYCPASLLSPEHASASDRDNPGAGNSFKPSAERTELHETLNNHSDCYHNITAIAGLKPAMACDPLSELDARLNEDTSKSNAPKCSSFREFVLNHARVLLRDGSGGKFSLEGRAPLEVIIDWLDKILRNTMDGEAVEIDGVQFAAYELKGSSFAIGGGAQWGKTILELNLMAYLTGIRFISVGNYLPDGPKVDEIVDQKFRPNVLDLYPWMSEMIQLGKTENSSGKTVNRRQSYQVTDGQRKAFGNFCSMHKPPTSVTLDAALLDEVDDIPDRNIGYVSGRMTNSPLRLTCFIGTQRVAGAGQNARLKQSSFHVKMVPCPECERAWNLEEEFPRCIRLAEDGYAKPTDPVITAEMGHNRTAHYYTACPECGTELDRDAGSYVAKHPERVKQAKLGIRVAQLNISAISLQEIVGAWYSAMEDPTGEAMVAFYCDRLAIPNAGAAQPITQVVLDRARGLDQYAMSLSGGKTGSVPRVAGMDMGPRCWLWVDEIRDDFTSALVWAELIASGNAPTRVPLLMETMNISCIFLDAGGEPDLTKRLVLSLNGLEDHVPPQVPRPELLKSKMGNLGIGLSWDGEKARWSGIRAAAVLFTSSEARGIEQTIGFTQDGKIYPLIKCNRAESIQAAVNDFLSPQEGVLEFVVDESGKTKTLRQLPRVRLPQTYIGAGCSQAILDGHLLNLRKERNATTGQEDWVDKVENHLGLSKVYSRLARTVAGVNRPIKTVIQSLPIARPSIDDAIAAKGGLLL